MHNKDYYILLSLIETIRKIEIYTKDYNSAEEFNNSTRDFDASMMNFIVIGENVGKLSENIKKQYPQINWNKIYGFRNIIAHHYFGINVDIVWEIINNDLPTLKAHLEKMLKQ
ncbi:MAG TPA: HepT-like ribonuclease domain-containing protein [Tangfeifania sp.]|nr:HepT-like ribonuclease domain-containing protein [Tangfeifania sp.]